MTSLRILAAIYLGIVLSACWPHRSVSSCPSDQICVDGTVRFFTFEGGFWAVRGDDSTTYDPVGRLPTDFRKEGLRVHLQARMRTDLGSYHMAGPIVDIVSIRQLHK